ncbi:CRISPR-associated endonuclease Cas2 [Candidatus Nomurabacteria bacterium RIFCSPHIGHO2_01_FULL_42_15]|uniref:CRISPR-associated endonuclease Cas2 n=1 Tax=Candidatus Nomurabacteria bacterium RIFCSPHIGHO2_01_FULL_42_15 TaxID=1801742 RepID=A0A1F6VFU7_9BACT|nr:MAG: CRISPR-associated endonuclease Cas2 [Candidatus Nomurabacteria bacterium RIFCSPHIGHO2_01_FULL_42_15]OGI93120.1 MAG: CRISPR-associated endonuclease Cas2 [Candidatus Nomurabacteria bacterium RIFCSPLOWO2_01_FULL_41_18]
MGNLEQEIKKKDKRKNIQKIILNTVFTAGMLGVALVAPNVLSAIKKLESSFKRKKNLKYSINDSFTRLREKGFIEIIEINGKKVARITRKGESKLDFLDKHNFKLKIPKKWDGRWRVVIFDIKESRSKTRFLLRQTLSQIGFIRLQNSVWLYPYDCEDLISLLKADFKIGKDVLYMIVEKLENDWHLRKTFNLPNSTGRKS